MENESSFAITSIRGKKWWWGGCPGGLEGRLLMELTCEIVSLASCSKTPIIHDNHLYQCDYPRLLIIGLVYLNTIQSTLNCVNPLLFSWTHRFFRTLARGFIEAASATCKPGAGGKIEVSPWQAKDTKNLSFKLNRGWPS